VPRSSAVSQPLASPPLGSSAHLCGPALRFQWRPLSVCRPARFCHAACGTARPSFSRAARASAPLRPPTLPTGYVQGYLVESVSHGHGPPRHVPLCLLPATSPWFMLAHPHYGWPEQLVCIPPWEGGEVCLVSVSVCPSECDLCARLRVDRQSLFYYVSCWTLRKGDICPLC
jgi:hypothetical protein